MVVIYFEVPPIHPSSDELLGGREELSVILSMNNSERKNVID